MAASHASMSMAEQERALAEEARNEAELKRAAAEDWRAKAEEDRKQADKARQKAEDARQEAFEARQAAENARDTTLENLERTATRLLVVSSDTKNRTIGNKYIELTRINAFKSKTGQILHHYRGVAKPGWEGSVVITTSLFNGQSSTKSARVSDGRFVKDQRFTDKRGNLIDAPGDYWEYAFINPWFEVFYWDRTDFGNETPHVVDDAGQKMVDAAKRKGRPIWTGVIEIHPD